MQNKIVARNKLDFGKCVCAGPGQTKSVTRAASSKYKCCESLQKHPRCCDQEHGQQSKMPGLHTLDGVWDMGQEGLEHAELLAHSG